MWDILLAVKYIHTISERAFCMIPIMGWSIPYLCFYCFRWFLKHYYMFCNCKMPCFVWIVWSYLKYLLMHSYKHWQNNVITLTTSYPCKPCLPCGYQLLRILTLQLHWDDSPAKPDVEENVHSVKGKNGWQSKVGGILHEITITSIYHYYYLIHTFHIHMYALGKTIHLVYNYITTQSLWINLIIN